VGRASDSTSIGSGFESRWNAALLRRTQLHTAKVMEDNPVALRLKELETLEKVTEKIDKISLFGGLDRVLKDLVKI
jgi:hypothetical protein